MSIRTKSSAATLILCLLVGLAAVGSLHAKGKQQATIACTRDGVAVSSIPSGTQITISGSGYKRNAQLALCIDAEGCTYPTADRDGEFSQGRTLYEVGVRSITVSEVGSRWSSYREKARSEISVTN
jgi:hypothetical protein